MGFATPVVIGPFRLEACPTCGYSLRGLGETGACPECGRPFDRDTIVLHGYARGSLANIANARPGLAILFACMPLGLLLNLATNRFGSRRWAVVFLLAWGSLVLWTTVKRWRTNGPGLVQVHLSPQGCLQVDSRRAAALPQTPPAPTPWHRIAHVDIRNIWVAEPVVKITLAERARFWLLQHVRVDAEVPGGAEIAAALEARIADWRDAVSSGGFPVIHRHGSPDYAGDAGAA